MKFAKRIWHGIVILKSDRKEHSFQGIRASNVGELLRQLYLKYQEIFKIKKLFRDGDRYSQLDGSKVDLVPKEQMQRVEQNLLKLDD